MNAPSVSVVITCYNYARYLEGCIASVLRQRCADLEIVVVNDGSTDNTDEVMGKFCGLKNLRYIKQPNSGQASAKNNGIRNSSGRFIAFLDADDLWGEGKLEKQIPLFSREEVGVVYCRAKYIDEEERLLGCSRSGEYLRPQRGNVTENLFLDNFVEFSSSVVRRECFEKFGLFDETLKMGIDWDLWLRISTGYLFDFVDEPLFSYRVGHAGQMSKNLEERQRCTDRIMGRFLALHPSLLSRGTVRNAYVYTYCNRGDYFRKIDRLKSLQYFLNALRLDPTELRAYKGFAKLLLGA